VEVVTRLHAVAGPALLVGLAVLAIACAILALLDRAPRVLEALRLVALALLVAQGVLGLVLVLRGDGPREFLHWIYGVAIVVVLLLPGGLDPAPSARVRSGTLAGAAAIGVLLAWRLWSTG
jgi:hypothetical protein